MATTSVYKYTDNHTRYITTEDSFATGMHYTNQPEEAGYAKALVNYQLKNSGTILTPRGGLQYVSKDISTITKETNKSAVIISTGSMYVQTSDETDAILCNYTLYGNADDSLQITSSSCSLVIDYNGTFLTGTIDTAATDCTVQLRKGLSSVHGMSVTDRTNVFGISASLEANTYLPIIQGTTKCIGQLKAKFTTTANTASTWQVVKLEPKDIQPTQAVNYGYNMLSETPYTFNNTSTTTGGIVLTGILPYDDQSALLLSARPGESINFELFYKYPTSDVGGTERYLVQWEAQDLDSNTDNLVIQQVRKSTEYVPGAQIILNYKPTYKAFSLICKIYKKSVVEAHTFVSNEDDYNNLLPDQVLVLASYYLTSDSNSSMLNVSAVNYDIGTASGMCAWQQRLVYWGVKNAPSTLFVSEINCPEYVPYPNNSEIFKDEIVCAIPYMTNLLVFTKTSLYQITLSTDGLSYTSTCVQERLNMSAEDACTVLTVQNMVYFKSDNYFYMVVPKTNSLTNQLQLAPVTRPLETFLDDFKKNIKELINSVYDINYSLHHKNTQGLDWDVELLSFDTLLDENQARNYYKFKVTTYTSEATAVIHYMDFMMCYDTTIRAWTTYFWESNEYTPKLYRSTVTGKSVYAYLNDNTTTSVSLSYYILDDMNPVDALDIGTNTIRIFKNYQYIDTGYQQHSNQYKKRFREIQFNVNSLDNNPIRFYTGFIVDDDSRKEFYKYNIEQITDTTDPNYGLIYVERELIDEIDTTGTTKLNTAWVLDASKFPEVTVNHVRFGVSGKGYGGSVKILSTSQVRYELLNISWVYRIMFAR